MAGSFVTTATATAARWSRSTTSSALAAGAGAWARWPSGGRERPAEPQSRISRHAVKSGCAREWGGWGRLSDDGPGQNNRAAKLAGAPEGVRHCQPGPLIAVPARDRRHDFRPADRAQLHAWELCRCGRRPWRHVGFGHARPSGSRVTGQVPRVGSPPRCSFFRQCGPAGGLCPIRRAAPPRAAGP